MGSEREKEKGKRGREREKEAISHNEDGVLRGRCHHLCTVHPRGHEVSDFVNNSL